MPWAAASDARSASVYIWRAREAMATTSLVAVREREKGLLGREIVTGDLEGSERWWMWSVESQEADMSRFCDWAKRTDFTPALWEERTV